MTQHAPAQPASHTSKEAALDVEPKFQGRTDRIVAWVKSLGASGATRDEIAVQFDLPINSVTGPVWAAVKAGRLRETLLERPTRWGAKARVLVAVVPEEEQQLTLLPSPPTSFRRYNH